MESNHTKKKWIDFPGLIRKVDLKRFLRTPHGLLIGSFAGLILLGAIVLWMPFSHSPGRVGFLDALFTATSAVCVTGLIVVDTGSAYTGFGQTVILVLIQLGGLGVMSFAALLFAVAGRRLSLQSEAALHDTFLQRDAAVEFRKVFRQILSLTVLIEFFGALCLFWLFLPRMRFSKALFSAIFHSVSAFCNAGFSIYRDSLVGMRGRFFVMLVIMALIVLGGLGYTVLLDFSKRSYRRLFPDKDGGIDRFSTHTRTVLWVTGILLTAGFLGLLLFGLTPFERGIFSKAWNALFQTVTVRTAGFNSIDVGALPLASLFLLILLMFIGGSPGSCAGGIKTTTVALWFAHLRSLFKREEEVVLFDRTIPLELVYRALILFGLAFVWNVFGALFLLWTESRTPGASMHDILFEQISAFATVGLSTGLTPKLTTMGKLWIILTMFVGRLGPLTFATLAISSSRRVHVRHPEGRIMIG